LAKNQGFLLVVISAYREPVMLERATLVAKALELDIYVYSPMVKPLLPRGLLADTTMLEKNRTNTASVRQIELDNALTVFRSHGLQAEGTIEWQHSIVRGVLKKVADKAPSLVMTAHRIHKGILEHLLTDDDLNLVRLCPTPLWLVRGRVWPEQPSIVAAIDPLHHGDQDLLVDELILTTAKHMAKALHCTPHVLHTIPESVAATIGKTFLPKQVEALEQTIEAHHQKEVYLLTDAQGFDKSQVHFHTGKDVVDALDEMGKPMQVALVVLGALSRNPLKHMLLGGTADRALRKLRVDVLVVKPPQPKR